MEIAQRLNSSYRWVAARVRRRDALGASALALVILSTSIGAPVADEKIETAELGFETSCERASSIDQPAPVEGKAWRKVVLKPRPECFRLTPTSVDREGVFPTTGFTLRAGSKLSRKQLAGRLTVTPKVELAIHETPEARTFGIKPTSPLREGGIYRFELAGKKGQEPAARWAFQVSARLRVVQTLPADEATGVPTDIGIELVFTHDDPRGIEDRFSIEPPVEGRFETHKRVVVFVPDELKTRTLYRVKLKSGVTAPGAEDAIAKTYSFAFETGRGKRKSGVKSIGNFGRRMWEAPTTRAPSLGYGGGPKDGTVTVTVYRYRTVGAFLRALEVRSAIPFWADATLRRLKHSTKPLTRTTRFEAKIRHVGDYDRFIEFPAPLPRGLYLVEASKPRWSRTQALLQVTDVAAHVTISRTRSVVWSHDLLTKKPLAGAAVAVDDRAAIARTGVDGKAMFTNPKKMLRLSDADLGEQIEARAAAFVVKASDGRLCIVAIKDALQSDYSYEYREHSFPGNPDLYWRYLYTDRHLYRLSDTVRFWGLVRSRIGANDDEPVTIEISGWDEASETNITVARRSVERTSRGTFIGSVPFRDASPGWYQLEARIGSRVIASTGLQIKDFVTPAYKLDVSARRRVLLSGETAEFDVAAAFYDGTPVPALGLKASFDHGKKQTATTDDSGHALIEHRVHASKMETSDGISLAPSRAEEAEISAAATLRVLPATITLGGVGSVRGDTGTITGSVRRFDFDRANAPDADPYGDFDGGAVAGRSVKATVTGTWYRRIDEGVEYDFISKRTHKRYRWESVDENVGSFDARTDRTGAYRISFPASSRFSHFSIELVARDGAGRAVEQDAWAWRSSHGRGSWSRYSHVVEVSKGPYSIGERARLRMNTNPAAVVADGVDEYLFMTAVNGIRAAVATRSATWDFRFSAGDVPGISTTAVRFTGYTYVSASGPVLAFDTSRKALTIDVTPRRDRYRPGQDATLDVRVTDRAGRPVAGAEVLLGAIDEALYQLQGQGFYEDLEILGALYDIPSSGIYGSYGTHVTPGEPAGPESGGEGPAREDFRDVALFDRVTTDANGRASIKFKVPDNLTSWRVTALGVTSDLSAGRSVTLIPVGLPMFVQPSLNDTYLVSDRPSIRLRAFGTALSRSGRVTYTVKAPSLSRTTLKASGTAFEPVDIDLPPLKAGSHRITVRASAAGRTDAVVRKISVVSSRLQRLDATFRELVPGDSLGVPSSLPDHPVTVVLSDHNRGRYLDELLELTWSSGDRLDQILPRVLARELLEDQFEQKQVRAPERFRPSMYQKPGGGLAIFPFSGEDLFMSARIAATAADRFDRRGLDRYFETVLGDKEETRARKIAALYGRAALGSAVLLEVQQATREADLSVIDRLRLGLAAAHLGDEPTARSLYDLVLEQVAEVRGPMIRLKTGRDADDRLEATALAAILGARLRDDLSPMLEAFVQATPSRDILTQLDRLEFLSVALPAMSGKAIRFSYVDRGVRTERSLAEGKSFALKLHAKDLKGIDLDVIEGRVGVSTYAVVELDPAAVEGEPELSVVRSFDDQTGPVVLTENALVKVTLDYTVPADADRACYQVDDLLPSGLAMVSDLYRWPGDDHDGRVDSYAFAVRDQRVSFCVYPDWDPEVITYYARVTGTGTFTAEPPTIQSLQTTDSFAIGRSATVTIR